MQMTLNDFSEFTVKKITKAGPGFAQIMWGAPGIGKSAVVRQLVKVLTETTGKVWNVIDARLSQMDAVDLRGIPNPDKERGITSWLAPDWLPRVDAHGEFGILLLDEIFQSMPSTQSAAMQLVLDRKLGSYTLPPGWQVIACSNRDQDKAAISRLQNSALDNRFTHHEIILDVPGWISWAALNNVHPAVVAFINFRPDQIHQYKDGNIEKGVKAFATPRTWEEASNVLKLELREALQHSVLSGTIGAGAAGELAGFIKVIKTIPKVDIIFSDPRRAPIPEDPGTQYALATLLVSNTTTRNYKAGSEYVDRIGAEFQALYSKLAVGKLPELKNTDTFKAMREKHGFDL